LLLAKTSLILLGIYLVDMQNNVCHFYARKQLLLSVRLSNRNSVRPSHGWFSQKRCKL